MSEQRNTVTYELTQGNEVVYIGTTKDPVRREREHREEGKQFSALNITSELMTEEGARKKEAEQLAAYRRNHHGRNPKYNKDSDG